MQDPNARLCDICKNKNAKHYKRDDGMRWDGASEYFQSYSHFDICDRCREKYPWFQNEEWVLQPKEEVKKK